MKNFVGLISILFLITSIFFHSCEEEEAIPTVTTAEVSDIKGTTSTCGGTVTYEGSSSVIARGVCWSTEVDPTIEDDKTSDGAGVGNFNSTLTGLAGDTRYYIRAYATNSAGTGYGMAISFITLPTVMTDIEGNTYSLVLIGSQLWFSENLKVTKYNDGSNIADIKPNGEWCNTSIGAFCWYFYSTEYKDLYGYLYNWYAVNTDRLCPAGSHVPSDTEWETLEKYLGTNQGEQMKTTSGWIDNGNGTNSSGFSGLPGGFRSATDGSFYHISFIGFWWSSTEYTGDNRHAFERRLSAPGNSIYRDHSDKNAGMTVRCIMD